MSPLRESAPLEAPRQTVRRSAVLPSTVGAIVTSSVASVWLVLSTQTPPETSPEQIVTILNEMGVNAHSEEAVDLTTLPHGSDVLALLQSGKNIQLGESLMRVEQSPEGPVFVFCTQHGDEQRFVLSNADRHKTAQKFLAGQQPASLHTVDARTVFSEWQNEAEPQIALECTINNAIAKVAKRNRFIIIPSELQTTIQALTTTHANEPNPEDEMKLYLPQGGYYTVKLGFTRK